MAEREASGADAGAQTAASKKPDPLDPKSMHSLKAWGAPPDDARGTMAVNAVVDCGWGRVLFAQTFADAGRVAETLKTEAKHQRDIALYLREPQVVLAHAPQELFLDPSHTYRLVMARYQPSGSSIRGISIRPLDGLNDGEAVNRIYRARNMVPIRPDFYLDVRGSHCVTLLVAIEEQSGAVVGVVTGVDHVAAFNDPDNGCSLWSLAVDPQCPIPGVGEDLVRALIELYRDGGRDFLDLSVMYDNKLAIELYHKLGFEQVQVYCVKKKNVINEDLFIGRPPKEEVNIYARIIIDEARRRGINVEIVDAAAGYFTLTVGGRSITCREALSELTTAVAMSRCDDKAVTYRVLKSRGLKMPPQLEVSDKADIGAFLEQHGRVVVKPARGEQGRAVSVDLRSLEEIENAIDLARQSCDKVLVEAMVEGADLRIIVIDYKVVAAAIRAPAQVRGDGKRTVKELIERQSKRRSRATQGESVIPMDQETARCVTLQGFAMDDVLEQDQVLQVRKTANLHTGGTIHDVTDRLHPKLIDAAATAAQALKIPVVGLDFLVESERSPDYVIIEANERPGLANHEPQPTAERFIDLLFPETITHSSRGD
jgi:GNAT-family acetyltransferase (TIGR03103 family)